MTGEVPEGPGAGGTHNEREIKLTADADLPELSELRSLSELPGVAGVRPHQLAGTLLDHRLHQVRIAAKRARYVAEAVRPVTGRKAKTLATTMESLQELLGDHQDAVVERGWLRELAVSAQEEFVGSWPGIARTMRNWPG